MPILILNGVGEAVEKGPRFKILTLNGSLDRETGGYGAAEFVRAVVEGCETHKSSTLNPGLASSTKDQNDVLSRKHVIGREREHQDVTAETVKKYVTHLIHIDHPTAPVVDSEVLASWGVECVRCYGRRGEDGKMRYDEKGLGQALGWILGRRDGKEKGERSRRNTIEGGRGRGDG